MKQVVIGVAAVAAATVAGADTFRFDKDAPGTVPEGWTCGVTGTGRPHWSVAADPAGQAGRVLLQDGKGTFPWCVRPQVAVADGFVEAKFVPVSGKQDQAGGVVWRWQDRDNYYVARANALENNVSLYYTERGSRKTLVYVQAPVQRGVPHVLRVEFAGDRIGVILDGKRYIDTRDTHFREPGGVGVWTKADSVTAFREFSYGSAAR